MSAMGQKQTFAVQNGMSALPPKADSALGDDEGLTLSVITLFFVILVGIPVLLWLSWRRNSDPNEQHIHTEPFGEWISRPFETWTGGISGREAAVQILLPIAAVAFGMTIFGLAFLFAVPHLA